MKEKNPALLHLSGYQISSLPPIGTQSHIRRVIKAIGVPYRTTLLDLNFLHYGTKYPFDSKYQDINNNFNAPALIPAPYYIAIGDWNKGPKYTNFTPGTGYHRILNPTGTNLPSINTSPLIHARSGHPFVTVHESILSHIPPTAGAGGIGSISVSPTTPPATPPPHTYANGLSVSWNDFFVANLDTQVTGIPAIEVTHFKFAPTTLISPRISGKKAGQFPSDHLPVLLTVK